MRNILDEIVKYKEEAIKSFKREPISFVDRVNNNKYISIISEIKRASPSKGDINLTLNPKEISISYEKNGADAISVLTEDKYFKGSFKDLIDVRSVTSLPILCKDFIIDKVQIDYAYLSGADIILLIVSCLNEKKLKELYDYATSLKLNIIVEVHTKNEVEIAFKLNPKIIGVNNRNLKTFKTNIDTTIEIAPLIKEFGAILISESGIRTKHDVEKLRDSYVDVVLVGEHLVSSNNIMESFNNLRVLKNG